MICSVKELQATTLVLRLTDGSQIIQINAEEYEIGKLLGSLSEGDIVAFTEARFGGETTLAVCNEDLVTYIMDGNKNNDAIAIAAKEEMEEYLRAKQPHQNVSPAGS